MFVTSTRLRRSTSPPGATSRSCTRRRRFVALVLLAALAVALVLAVRAGMATLGGVPASAPEGNITGPPARVVVVQPGDTMWTIARTVQPDGDVRPLVDALARRAIPGRCSPATGCSCRSTADHYLFGGAMPHLLVAR